MMAAPKNIPEIRYAEFTDEWEEKRLGDEADISGGGTPSTSNPEYWGGNIDWYAPAEINEQIYVTGSQKKITKLGLEKSSAKILPIGTILFTSRAGIGNTAILAKTGATNQGFQSIIPHKNKLNSYFIFSKTYELKKYAETVGGGSTFMEVSGKQMENMLIRLPGMAEQNQIAKLFSTLDTLITLHQREHDKTVNLKKAMLEKMFPKEGASRPEVRFAGFSGDWETMRLGDAAEFNPISVLPDKFEYVDLESVVGNDLISHRTEMKYAAPSRAQRLAKHGDIFYQTVRPYQKNNYLFELDHRDYVFSTGYAQLRPRINGSFLFSSLQEERFVKTVLDRCTGTSYPAVNSRDLADIDIQVPTHKTEQIEIGNALKTLDRLITLQQQRLTKLKNMKKALLEKMFV